MSVDHSLQGAHIYLHTSQLSFVKHGKRKVFKMLEILVIPSASPIDI